MAEPVAKAVAEAVVYDFGASQRSLAASPSQRPRRPCGQILRRYSLENDDGESGVEIGSLNRWFTQQWIASRIFLELAP